MALGSYATSQLNVVGERQIPTTNMFNFQQKQQVEDKNISSDEARQLFTGKPPEERKMIYEKLKSGGFSFEDEITTTQPAPAPQTGGFGQGIQNISAGIAAGAQQAVGGTLGIVGDFLSAPFSKDVSIGGIFTGKNVGGLGQIAREETARQQAEGARAFGAETESMGYKGGKFGTGLVLAIATPGGVLGAAGKGTQFGKSLAQYGSIAQGLGKGVDTASKLATSKVGLGATQGVIETGKFMGLTEGRLGTPGELALGATVGGALPVAGAALKAGARYGTDLLGKSTGAGGDAIRNAFKYAGSPDFVKALRGEISDTQILENANQALQSIRQNRNAVYGKGYEQFLQKSKEIGEQNIDDITQSFLEKVKGLGVKVKDDVLDFSKSKIANSGDEKLLTETLSDLRKFSKSTPEELDILKQRIYDRFVVEKPIGTTTASEGIAKLVSGEIKNKLVNMIPEYKAMSKSYEEATGAIAEISKTLSLGKPNAAMTAMTRLAQTMKDNLSYRGEALKLLEDLSGVNLTAQLAGAALAPGIGKGLAGVAQGQLGAGIGLGIAGLSNPAFWAAIPLGSPRLIGELANGLGITAQKLKSALSKIPGGNLAQGFVASRSTANPFKDISFIKKMQKGEVQGLSKEALDAMQGVKTVKEAMQKAKSAGVEDEIRRVYPLEGSRFDLSKNKKGFLQVGKVDEAEAKLMEEARKYKSAEEFVKSVKGERLLTGQRADWKPKPLREYNPETDDSLFYGPGLYLTPTKEIAEQYASNGGVVHTVIADIKNPLKPSMKDWQTFIGKGNGKMKLDFLKRKGYDAVVDVKGKYKQVMVVDPTSVKTESQLKDIYNQATKK